MKGPRIHMTSITHERLRDESPEADGRLPLGDVPRRSSASGLRGLCMDCRRFRKLECAATLAVFRDLTDMVTLFVSSKTLEDDECRLGRGLELEAVDRAKELARAKASGGDEEPPLRRLDLTVAPSPSSELAASPPGRGTWRVRWKEEGRCCWDPRDDRLCDEERDELSFFGTSSSLSIIVPKGSSLAEESMAPLDFFVAEDAARLFADSAPVTAPRRPLLGELEPPPPFFLFFSASLAKV